LLPKFRTVLTIHDCIGAHTTKGLKRLILILFWYKLPLKRCVAVTAISQFAKEEALQYVHCDPGLIRVIHDPVASQFVADKKPFNIGRPVILQVGTGENKNILRVAEALRGLSCHLDVIGRLSGKHREALRRHGISYSENFGLTTEEVAERYRYCDMVVLASTYEGFGLPIVEANATGRPIVTANICSMPEVAGPAACFVDPFDSSSIRQGILRVMTDTSYRKDLIALGFENVKRFRAEGIAAQYAALYREIVSRYEGRA
jgi:glycosyltransferase involved in cell wall biosynthesis